MRLIIGLVALAVLGYLIWIYGVTDNAHPVTEILGGVIFYGAAVALLLVVAVRTFRRLRVRRPS